MYPVMINIREKKVVVVGGGKVAARKIKTLLAEQAAVTVVSPTLHADIPQAEIQWLARPYQTGDLEGAKLVFACTDQAEVNRQIMEDAAPSQLVNNTGDKTFSDFWKSRFNLISCQAFPLSEAPLVKVSYGLDLPVWKSQLGSFLRPLETTGVDHINRVLLHQKVQLLGIFLALPVDRDIMAAVETAPTVVVCLTMPHQIPSFHPSTTNPKR